MLSPTSEVSIPVILLEELIQGNEMFRSLVEDAIKGKATPKKHEDWESVLYLYGDAGRVITDAEKYIMVSVPSYAPILIPSFGSNGSEKEEGIPF